MRKNFIPSAMAFVDEIVDAEHGTKYHRLDLFHNDLWVGYIDYREYRGEPTITHVGVPHLGDRRRGFATALVQRLQQTYPGRQIGWLGTATRDGASFYAALPKIEKKVQAVIDQQRHLASLERQRDAMLSSQEPLTRVAVRELNEINSNIDDLKNSLSGKSIICSLVDTAGAVPYPGSVLPA